MAKDLRKLERTRWPGIYKRGESYVVIYRDARGNQKKKYAPTQAAARVLQAENRTAVARGEYRQLSKDLFTDYVKTWIDGYGGSTSKGRPKPHTLKDYEAAVTRREFRESFRGLRLPEVEPEHIEAYARKLEADGLSARTVRNNILPLRLALAHATHRRHINFNPTTALRLPPAMGTRKGKRSPAEVRALDEAEVRRLLLAAAKLPATHRLLAEFVLQTGCRIGEALALTWADVVLDPPPSRTLGAHKVTPHISISKRVYRGTNDTPKSAKGTRNVPLSPAMVARLRKHRCGATDSRHVFINSRGEPLNYYDARRHFKSAAEKAGIPWAGFHTLRHTCATFLFRSPAKGGLGANAVQVQLWLGHHKPSFTLDTYVHLLEEDLPDAGGFDALLSNRGNGGATRAPKSTRNERAEKAA
jgi:integrase